YIAQPPLYRVKHGKTERYLKDDHEYHQFLLSMAMQESSLIPRAGAASIQGDALEEIVRSWLLSQAIIERLTHHINSEVLYAIVEHDIRLNLADAAQAKNSAEKIAARLENNGVGGSIRVFAAYDDTRESWLIRSERMHHGNVKVGLIDEEFLHSGDYAQLRKTAELLSGLFSQVDGGVVITRGEKKCAVNRFAEAMRWLMNEVERGIAKQRYKGLGEMNPEQLWETTMDPQVRRLLRVNIEDAIGADAIFSTLMGELVEPRRNFIESNALYARNIDV
ncbi:MAG: DNA gyrase subunit B, partial [Zoogloeaceae bacterium]|nr:DNA gyrase subunit B [Zoogloeaceae bacterium]